ncbi:hypothetical protein OROGR_000485 [Orobanche gracilis]
MLRRRAVQNRSDLLKIDSDDDEKHERAHGEQFRNISVHNQDSDGGDDVNRAQEDFYLVGEDDDKLTDESADDQYLDGDWVTGYMPKLDEGWIGRYGPEPKNFGGVISDGYHT